VSAPRLLELTPWLIRAVLPRTRIGTYVLFGVEGPSYVGRSDTDLRRRLLEHSSSARAPYFSYEVHTDPLQAFEVECGLFHALKPQLTNAIHPDRPAYSNRLCPFCPATFQAIVGHRLRSAHL
jgi:hypothetical protein